MVDRQSTYLTKWKKNKNFNYNQCSVVLYFYEEPLVPILQNKLRTKFWFWYGSG
jgi:hypothetical protein